MRLSWVLRRRRSISWRTGGSNVRAIAPPRTTRPVDQLPKTAKVQRIVGLFRLPRLYGAAEHPTFAVVPGTGYRARLEPPGRLPRRVAVRVREDGRVGPP